jgi:hypothetical protein
MIGVGSVVTRGVPDRGLVAGNRPRTRGHICECARPLPIEGASTLCSCGLAYRLTYGMVA